MLRFAAEVQAVWKGWVRSYERARLFVARADYGGRSAVAIALYCFTFVLAALSSLGRFALVYVVSLLVGLVCGVAPADGLFGLWGLLRLIGAALPAPMVTATVVSLGPLVWSLAAFRVPSTERRWRRIVGARRPSIEEVAEINEMVGPLEARDSRIGRVRCYVLDAPWAGLFVRGRVLLMTTGLLARKDRRGLLAHDLFHAVGWDGVLTAAVMRFAVWGDVMGGIEERDGEPGAVPWFLLRCWVAFAGGRWVVTVTRPLWVAVWRARERRADAYAAELGQAEVLADYLESEELPRARPHRYRYVDPFDHEPTAIRIERLRLAAGKGTDEE